MKKQKKKELLQDICNNVVSKCKIKYYEFQNYLSKEFYEDLENNLLQSYNSSCGISPNVYLLMFADTVILKELSKIVRNNEINIEISLIKKYTNLLRVIMLKMGYTFEEYQKYGEDILINAIETYNGENLFGVHLVKIVRKAKENISKEKYDCLNQNESEKNIIDRIESYLSEKELSNRTPNNLESLCYHINLIDRVSKNNQLKDFIYLKYGFYNEIYFSLEEIYTITNESIDNIKKYYKDSLLLLKEVINEYIDKVSIFNIEKNTSKKYILQNKNS